MAKTGTSQPKSIPAPRPIPATEIEEEDIFATSDVSIGSVESKPPSSQFVSAKKLQEEQKAKIEARKLPPFPKRMSLGELIDRRNELNEEQKDHLVAYVYRLEPKIDRRLKNPESPTYIDLLASDSQFNHDYFIKTHGGGKYHIRINDTDVRSNGQVSECIHEIDRNQHDPVLDLEELEVWEKKNEPYVLWLMAKGRLDNSRKVIKNPTANANQGQNMQNDVTQKLLDTVLGQLNQLKNQNANDPAVMGVATRYMDILSEKMKAESPHGQVNMLSSLMAMLTPLLTPKQDNAIQYLQLMETIRDNSNKQMDQMRQFYETKLDSLNNKLLELSNKPVEKADVASEIEKIKGLAEVMGLAGGGKTSVLETVLDKLAEPLTALVNIFGPVVASKFTTESTQPPQHSHNQGTPRILPDSMISSPQSTTTITNEEPPMETTTVNTVPDFLDQLIDQYGMMLVGYIGNNKNGADVADSLFEASLIDMPAYNLATKDGVEGILTKMRSRPAFWSKISQFGEARVIKFVREFVDWGKEEEDNEVIEPEEIVQ